MFPAHKLSIFILITSFNFVLPSPFSLLSFSLIIQFIHATYSTCSALKFVREREKETVQWKWSSFSYHFCVYVDVLFVLVFHHDISQWPKLNTFTCTDAIFPLNMVRVRVSRAWVSNKSQILLTSIRGIHSTRFNELSNPTMSLCVRVCVFTFFFSCVSSLCLCNCVENVCNTHNQTVEYRAEIQFLQCLNSYGSVHILHRIEPISIAKVEICRCSKKGGGIFILLLILVALNRSNEHSAAIWINWSIHSEESTNYNLI